MMTAEDVVRVLDLLEREGIHVWLDGGWGVDALLGEQTRGHADLDIALRHEVVPRFLQSMESAGFSVLSGGQPMNFVMSDAEDHQVDVHLVDFSETRFADDGGLVYGPKGLAYEVGGLDGVGTILGRRVACETPEYQIKSHTGYEPGENDFRDVLALHERFGITLPPPFDAERRVQDSNDLSP